MPKNWLSWRWQLKLVGWSTLVGVGVGASLWDSFASRAFAQVAADPSLGTAVTVNGAAFQIRGGTTVGGTNLFHSFSSFSVPNGGIADFLNAPTITNILARVTGGTPSDIQGLIRSQGTANLFLMNPNGIVFGPGAQLAIGGSFVGTTANAIQFPGGGEFSPTSAVNQDPVLTVNPSAFLFNQISTGAITNNSIAPAGLGPSGINVFGLRVPDGRSLLLLGGNVSLDRGQIQASGGRVELGGLAGTGTVGLTANGNNLSLSFPDGVARGDVSLTNGSRVDVIAGGGGSIAVNARNLNVSGVSSLAAGIGARLGTVGSRAGNIEINATDTVIIDGTSSTNFSSTIVNGVLGSGTAGDIVLKTNSLNIIGNAQIGSATNGQGNAGSVTIQAEDKVSLSGINSAVLSAVAPLAVGNGAEINIKARSLSLSNGAQVSTSTTGKGNAGNVQIQTADFVSASSGSVIRADTFGQGNAGSITIQANALVSLQGKTYISSNVEAGGVGRGGNVNITAGALSLTGGAQLQSGIREASATTPGGNGNAGNINVTVGDTIAFDGVDSNGSASGAFSIVEPGAMGKGGDINIHAGSLSLSNGAVLNASTSGRGDAGNVDIDVRDAFTATGVNSRSSSNSGAFSVVQLTGMGKGGNISIKARSLSVTDGAVLSSSTIGNGNAGNVKLDVHDAVTLSGVNSSNGFGSVIGSVVAPGARGNGGDINVQAGSLSLSDGDQLRADTFGQGDAGSVFVQANGLVSLQGKNTVISSSVEAGGVGRGGNINITAEALSLSGGAELQSGVRGASATTPGGNGNAGNINVAVSDTIAFDGVDSNGFASGAFSTVEPGAVGKGGDINIHAGSFSLTNGALLNASTFGQGDAGSVFVQANGLISLQGKNTDISSNVEAGGVGKGGNINITAGALSLSGGAQLQSLIRRASATTPGGNGNAGTINVTVSDTIAFDGVDSNGFASGAFSTVELGAVGKGGDINIHAGSFSLTSGAQLRADTFGQGDAGNVTIQSSGPVLIDQVGSQGFSSGIGTFVNFGAVGKGGDINIQAESLSLTNGALLRADTFGQGDAGNVTIRTIGSVSLGGVGSNSFVSGAFSTVGLGGIGKGGNININARSLSLADGAVLSAQSQGAGRAGNINVNVRQTLSADNGSITAAANQAGGGNITLNARDIRLRHSSLINTNVAQGTGGGGNIKIDANTFVALEDSDILANANQGQGGNITINSAAFLADIFSSGRATPVRYTGDITPFRGNGRVDISASSAVGISGTVTTPDSSLIQNNLIQLPKNLIDPNTLLANSCIVRSSKQGGSFIIAGAGGLPPRPGDAAISPYPTGTVRAIPTSTVSDRSNRTVPGTNQTHSWKLGDPVVEPQGVFRLADGQMVMSRECSQ